MGSTAAWVNYFIPKYESTFHLSWYTTIIRYSSPSTCMCQLCCCVHYVDILLKYVDVPKVHIPADISKYHWSHDSTTDEQRVRRKARQRHCDAYWCALLGNRKMGWRCVIDDRPPDWMTPVISRPTDADDAGAAEMTHVTSSPPARCPAFSVVSPVHHCNSHCSTNADRARSSSINYGFSGSGGEPRISAAHALLEQQKSPLLSSCR